MPYRSVKEAIQKHPNLAKYSPKAQSAWFKAFNSCWFATKGTKDEGKCFRIAYSAANKAAGVKSIRELNPDGTDEELQEIVAILRDTRLIESLDAFQMQAIPNTVWEQLAFHSADRMIERARESGISIPDEIIELYRIRKAYRGELTVEDADYLWENYDQGVYLRDEFYAVWMGQTLERTFPGVVVYSEKSYLEFLTIAGIVSALQVRFDATNAYGWRQDIEHAGATALYTTGQLPTPNRFLAVWSGLIKSPG